MSPRNADRQARSLDVLLSTVNRHAPDRNKASDGGLASPEHHRQNPGSDHEPNAAGVWRARDFTNDPKRLPGAQLAGALSGLLGKHAAMMSGAYVIWNRRIISFDRLNEGWRKYSGDPHTGHVHLSVSTAVRGYDSLQPWDLWPLPPTRIARARALLVDAAKHAGPVRKAAILAALKILPKR